MNFLRNKVVQKTSTLFLLVLFVFIHAVKTFHTHDFTYAPSANNFNKNASVVKAGFFCAICDFQIAKDSDAEVSTLHIEVPCYNYIGHSNYILPQLHSFSVTSSVRGPPVMA